MTDANSLTGRLEQEGREILDAARALGLEVMLLGGVAIRVLLGEKLHPAFDRPVGDLDLLTRKGDGGRLERLLADRGWLPARSFNALNGARRLLFNDAAGETQVDVFVESFEMCHRLPLADSLAGPGLTLPATDLLMTKLQIVELNAKDRADLYGLLLGCEIGDGRPEALDPARLAELTSRDWGLHHTFELNLAALPAALSETALSEPERAAVRDRVEEILHAMEAAPKSRGWRLRQRVGERKQWYETPEEVDR
jgi:hypothetical protein